MRPFMRFIAASAVFATLCRSGYAAELRGRILDSDTGKAIAARVYVRTSEGKYLHVESVGGKAVDYEKIRSRESVEVHTSISAHPFRIDVVPGKLTLVVERGKEYHTHSQEVDVTDQGAEVVIRLHRWIDMNKFGWFSGETHVHRTLSELPTAMLAEDMNVGLPLTHWVTRSHTPPTLGNKNTDASVKAELIQLDDRHVIYTLNTEYEIFTVGGKRHTLGAVFALNHKKPLAIGAPPVAPIAAEVQRQGGLLELDKHNWPWSMMLPPIMKVDLYELTNNHIWRTGFQFRDFGEPPPKYLNAAKDPRGGMSEQGWIDYTFENYYALLNCGFKMMPTAGCASGVHPVPLGFGRVYVHQPDGFTYERWMKGLGQGQTFVTTGPMLDVRFNGHVGCGPTAGKAGDAITIRGWVESQYPLGRIELLDAGQVVQVMQAHPALTKRGSYRVSISFEPKVEKTTWLAVRCFARTEEGRPRFAHSAPHHVTVPGSKIRPRPEQAKFLAKRVRDQIERSRAVLSEMELREYKKALAFYEQFLVDE